MTFIRSIGTAVPEKSFTQRECWEALQRARRPELTPRTRAVLQGILNHDNGIERRSLALDRLDDCFDIDPDTLNRRFVKHAPALASAAARQALARAGLEAREVDGLVVSTCTGYLCPGLTSYVAEALGTRPNALLLDLVGQGCGAALPNLRTAHALLESQGCEHVLSVCVEVCSAAFYLDNDLGVLVSACLFGDGAAAALVSARPGEGERRVRFKAARSITAPEHRDALRFEQKNGMLRNILTLPVPKLAADHAGRVLDELLAEQEVPREAIAGWVLHAGGRKVLEELRWRLGLDEDATRLSAVVLREYGNLSSPFVLFVLDSALREKTTPGLWWMSSFGAGFSCHGALLEVA
ncbi:MAG: 3-oxoacyl-[acyl-carrier-protein] synthase III C-terminal domain-containing protein [Usitatibacter sp.]